MSTFSLSTTQPDYEQINDQLVNYLSSKESWASLSNNKTGTMLVDAISAVGAYDQYSIWAAVNETTLENAVIPESIYTNNIFLGNHLTRRTPASVSVSLQNSNADNSYLEVPKYSQFDIEGTKYFNAETFIFDGFNPQQTLTLYQGEIHQQTFTATGESFQQYELEADEQFSISDEHIYCKVGIDEYEKTTSAIFTFGSSDKIFYENSNAKGNVNCLFGDGVYGCVPTTGAEIIFKYAVTLGSGGNSTSTGQKVTCADYSALIGETLTNPTGGGDETSIEYYRLLGSQSAGANGRAITRDDIKAVVCAYPGVLDCRVYCQAEIAPLDKRWMSVFGLLLLTEDSFDDTNWKSLVSYMDTHGICGAQYKWYKAESVSLDIELEIYLKKNADLTECKNLAENKIRTYLELQTGSLGRSLYKSDLENIILSGLSDYVDYVDISSPVANLVVNQNEYIELNDLTVTCQYSDRDNQYWVNPLSTKG